MEVIAGGASASPAVDLGHNTSAAAVEQTQNMVSSATLPADPRRSRSRGRSKSRSKSIRRTHLGGGTRSMQAGIAGSAGDRTQNTKGPEGQKAYVGQNRTWANVARVITKGYSLSYVPPTLVEGEEIVIITPEITAAQNPFWMECIVGQYIGKKAPFKITEEALRKAWGDKVAEIKLHENGFYLFRVPDAEVRRKIIDSGPVSIFSCTLMLQQWHPKLN